MFTERCQTTGKTCRSYINSLLWMCLQDSVQTTTRQPPLSLINKQCHHILQAYTHTWLFPFLFSCSFSYLHLLHKNDSSILALPYHFGLVYEARTKLETFHSSTHCHSKTWKPPRHTLVDHGHHGNSVLQVGTLSCCVCLEATLTNTRRCPEHIWSSQMQVQELVLWLPSYFLWATAAHTATLCHARNTTRRLGTFFLNFGGKRLLVTDAIKFNFFFQALPD